MRTLAEDVAEDVDEAVDEAVSRRSDGSTRNELLMGHEACGMWHGRHVKKATFGSARIGLRPNKSLVILRAMSKYVGLKGSHTHSHTQPGLHMFSWPPWLPEKCFFMLA